MPYSAVQSKLISLNLQFLPVSVTATFHRQDIDLIGCFTVSMGRAGQISTLGNFPYAETIGRHLAYSCSQFSQNFVGRTWRVLLTAAFILIPLYIARIYVSQQCYHTCGLWGPIMSQFSGCELATPIAVHPYPSKSQGSFPMPWMWKPVTFSVGIISVAWQTCCHDDSSDSDSEDLNT